MFQFIWKPTISKLVKSALSQARPFKNSDAKLFFPGRKLLSFMKYGEIYFLSFVATNQVRHKRTELESRNKFFLKKLKLYFVIKTFG